MISNQAYPKPWTSYFIGQSRSAGDASAVIQSDGSVTLRYAHIITGNLKTTGIIPVGQSYFGSCGVTGVQAFPIFSDHARMNGLPPENWAVAGGVDASGCY